MSKRIFSGVQPSGVLHLGNYLGAIKQWIDLQNDSGRDPSTDSANSLQASLGQLELVFCIVDLHAITTPQDPKLLKDNILSLAALYLAAGVDPTKASIFVQSTRPEHSELAWILNCFSSLGELKRMTQFKDKSGANQEKVSVGLFDYPVLMAADILLYQTDLVPVGEDQKQHVELTRDLAERFNKKFGPAFTVPQPLIPKSSARIMGLDDPTKKMSKSAPSPLNYISLLDDADTVDNKIKRAVTDSGSEVKSGPDKPAISNLLNIMSAVTNKSIDQLVGDFQGKNYGQFKSTLAESIIDFLKPLQEKYQRYLENKSELVSILEAGSEKIAPLAQETLKKVQKALGLGV